jgi:hypothetical protein
VLIEHRSGIAQAAENPFSSCRATQVHRCNSDKMPLDLCTCVDRPRIDGRPPHTVQPGDPFCPCRSRPIRVVSSVGRQDGAANSLGHIPVFVRRRLAALQADRRLPPVVSRWTEPVRMKRALEMPTPSTPAKERSGASDALTCSSALWGKSQNTH